MNESIKEEQYVMKNNKRLKCGYTTGSCAAAATKAATTMLFLQKEIKEIDLITPKNIRLHLKVEYIEIGLEQVTCAIQKDAGDDPDVTNGSYIYATVKKEEHTNISIDGGIGVGRVTKRGLQQEIGEAAINKVPAQMITMAAREICEEYEYKKGLSIIISVPDGERLAKKTFNPRLGIIGGISILGTTGIVEPMSEQALIDSIKVEMKIQIAEGAEYLLFAPGNYGVEYGKNTQGLKEIQSIKCSNYIGSTIDMAVELGVKGLLFMGHIGKFIKVAGGIMNTHSREADARAEIMASHVILAGGDAKAAKEVLECTTTEEGLLILQKYNLIEPIMHSITEKIEFYMNNRAYNKLLIGAVIFSGQQGFLGETKSTELLLEKMRK